MESITRDDIINIYNNIVIVEEPAVTFPQANSFDRVIELMEILKTDKYQTKNELTEIFHFRGRQTDYYFNACKYLGLVNEREVSQKKVSKKLIVLTDEGERIFSLPYRERQIELVKVILQHKPFYKVFELMMKNKDTSDEEKINCIKENAISLYSDTTVKRRLSTVMAWLKWIEGLYIDIEI